MDIRTIRHFGPDLKASEVWKGVNDEVSLEEFWKNRFGDTQCKMQYLQEGGIETVMGGASDCLSALLKTNQIVVYDDSKTPLEALRFRRMN